MMLRQSVSCQDDAKTDKCYSSNVAKIDHFSHYNYAKTASAPYLEDTETEFSLSR